MKNEKEFLLEELKEHTTDCDWARAQHFNEEARYKKKSQRFNQVQSFVFLSTIAMYVMAVSGISSSVLTTVFALILTVASTLLEILSYMLNYDQLASSHWKAAQVYADLYRKCQFFCSNYADASTAIWKEKLQDISEELSNVSLLSPSLSEASYHNVCTYLEGKKYPVHKAILDKKMEPLEDVIACIKHVFVNSKIEIYLFGSYVTSMYHNDIDIAVIVHEQQVDLNMKEAISLIESDYAKKEIRLDISIITEDDIVSNRCTQFIKNIRQGICYFKSPDLKRCIQDYDMVLCNYPEMVQYFTHKAEAAYGQDEAIFFSHAFYMYYHALTAILQKHNVNWYGEASLLSECDLLSAQNSNLQLAGLTNEHLSQIVMHARLFCDEKNKVFIVNTVSDGAELEKFYRYFSDDQLLLNQITLEIYQKTARV